MLQALFQRNNNLNSFNLNEIYSKQIFSSRLPNIYGVDQYTYPSNNHDKIFASSWIKEDTVAIGTKDNKLNIWNIYKKDIKTLSLPFTNVSYDRGCGIHDIDFYKINDTDGLLISGSDCPNDIAVFETRTFKSIKLLQGHDDWVFGSKFIDSNTIFSGGRDGKICFWNLKSEGKKKESNKFSILSPYYEHHDESKKYRSIGIDYDKKLCYALNSIGTVDIWDGEIMKIKGNIILDDVYELVSMNIKQNDNLIAIGSRSYTSLYDPRMNEEIVVISHVDFNWGVRSLLFLENFLIIGGGSGIVSFIDMRKPEQYYHTIYHKCKGVVRNSYPEIDDENVPQAVYTLSTNFSQSNLFVGGGPLLVGIYGYFGSVWN